MKHLMRSLIKLVIILALAGPPVVSKAAGQDVEHQSQDNPIIPVNIIGFEHPPLFHTSTSGTFSGIIGETINSLCEISRLDCTVNLYPVARAYAKFESGEGQVLLSAILPRFDKCCAASDWVYHYSNGIYSSEPVASIPREEKALSGKSIIVIRGWQSPYTTFPNLDRLAENGDIILHKANGTISSIRMLNGERGDFLWGTESFRWYFDKLGVKKNLNYVRLNPVYIVLLVHKQHHLILQRLNNGFQLMKDRGMLNEKSVLKEEIMKKKYQDAPHPRG